MLGSSVCVSVCVCVCIDPVSCSVSGVNVVSLCV
jgi:hypothetical protein